MTTAGDTTGSTLVPASLRDPALAPLWSVVRERLDGRGPSWRGRVRIPGLDAHGRYLLSSLIGPGGSRTVDIGRLETALVDRGVGSDLVSSLEALGHPLSPERALRRARREAARSARAAAAEAVESWPEPWARDWLDEIALAGVLRDLDAEQVVRLIRGTRAVLDAVCSGTPNAGEDAVASSRVVPRRGRTEIAAHWLGSAHLLDQGTRTEAAATRALRRAQGLPADLPKRHVWEHAGVSPDLVSAPALTWGLRPDGAGPAAMLARTATDAGTPVHLTLYALRAGPLSVPSGSVVLVAENPRLVEAAAERHLDVPVVATNGNPSTTVQYLVGLLLRCGARVLYHGDFDAPGLAIAGRMIAAGCEPCVLRADDYDAALAVADATGLELPRESATVPPTPWSPRLARRFEQERRIVHEERVIDAVFDAVQRASVASRHAGQGSDVRGACSPGTVKADMT